MEEFIQWWLTHVPLSPRMSVFIVSMIPLIEERGGLLLASLLKIPVREALFWCVLGNCIPVPFILLGIEKLIHWLDKHHFSKTANWIVNKAEKNRSRIDRYGYWGLTLFVGIPLPGTGAWTGSLGAALFDMDLKKASLHIFFGILLAALIMTILSYGLLGAII